MLSSICVQELQVYSCIHLSYLEDQRNLKIYNKTDIRGKKLEKKHSFIDKIRPANHQNMIDGEWKDQNCIGVNV